MDLRNDYAPRMTGSIPYQLRNEQGGINKLLATIIIGLLALAVQASGVIWRLLLLLAKYSAGVSKSALKADLTIFRNVLRNIVVPVAFVVMGYYFFKDWTLIGVRNLSIVIMLMGVLVLAFRGSRKEKGDSK